MSTALPEKVSATGWRRLLSLRFLENVFFVLATVSCFIFAITVVLQSGSVVKHALGIVVMWVVLSYLAMPRLNSILTAIYVPDYFMGRTRAADGVFGDPVNLALNGTEDQIHSAMRQAGWAQADPVTLRSSWGIVISSVFRRSYPQAPVSPLFLFRRQQDFAYQQEVDGSATQRHHVRFWKCPPGWLLPGGRKVDWLAAGSYDTAVGLSLFTGQITHRIDANIDVERDYIISTVRAAIPEAKVEVLSNFSTGYHSRNGGGDRIHTDGNLPILQLGDVPVTWRHATPAVPESSQVSARPLSILIAALLSFAATVVTTTRDVFRVSEFEGLDAATVMAVVIALAVALCLIALALAVQTYRGRLWARVCLLVLVAFSLLGHIGIRQQSLGGLLSVGVDVVIMYALTSTSARAWTQRRD